MFDFSTLSQKKQNCLGVVETVLENDSAHDLWKRYFMDLVHDKLHLEADVAPLTYSLLESHIGVLEGGALTRLVMLHVRLHVRQLDIAKVANILRQITRIHQKTLTTSAVAPDVTLAALVSNVMTCEQTKHPSLAATVINTLFQSLRFFVAEVACTSEVEDSHVNQWYSSYQSLVS